MYTVRVPIVGVEKNIKINVYDKHWGFPDTGYYRAATRDPQVTMAKCQALDRAQQALACGLVELCSPQ